MIRDADRGLDWWEEMLKKDEQVDDALKDFFYDVEKDEKSNGGSAPGLPSGDQSRFLTGVAQSGQERLAREQSQSLQSIDRGIKELVNVQNDQKTAQNIVLHGGGVFGGLH